MKKLLLLLTLTAFQQEIFAQGVGINTTSPDPSAALDIQSTNKGILIPKVALQSLTDKTTIIDPANSLMVYNTNASLEFGTGYYYNAGSVVEPSWRAFSKEEYPQVAFCIVGSQDFIPSSIDHQVKFDIQEYNFGNGYSLQGKTFTAPIKGIYHFDAQLYGAGGIEICLVRVRGGVIKRLYSNRNNSINAETSLEQGDLIYVTYRQNTGDEFQLQMENDKCHFNGRLVMEIK